MGRYSVPLRRLAGCERGKQRIVPEIRPQALFVEAFDTVAQSVAPPIT
jgi:hypothetical protein